MAYTSTLLAIWFFVCKPILTLSCALPTSQNTTTASALHPFAPPEPPVPELQHTRTIWVTSTVNDANGPNANTSTSKALVPTITVTTMVTAEAAVGSSSESSSGNGPAPTSLLHHLDPAQDDNSTLGPATSSLDQTPSQIQPPPKGAESTATPDAVLTDGTGTVQLFVVDVGFPPSKNQTAPADPQLFSPPSLDVQPGDIVLFRLHGPYLIYPSKQGSPCGAPRLSLNTISPGKEVSSYQMSVRSSGRAWYSASLVDRPQDCNNHTIFVMNTGNS
ncbi:hypothetical protein BJY01DRAFT_254070 [Aspergillus pseudoustus]|uniref:Ubiquitin 3 binding protein But2 C-terminal domain-containing protein n=1 Tax=Aspergillus pseudoustus TaxID=1810923 RepID=A0ABR4IWG4_9EURO